MAQAFSRLWSRRRGAVLLTLAAVSAGAVGTAALAEVYETPEVQGQRVARVATGGEDTPQDWWRPDPLITVNTNGGEAHGFLLAVSNEGDADGGTGIAVSNGGTALGPVGISPTGDAYGLVSVSVTGSSQNDPQEFGVNVSALGHARGLVAVSGTGTVYGQRMWLAPQVPSFAAGGGGASGDVAVAGTGDARTDNNDDPCCAITDVPGTAVSGTGNASGSTAVSGTSNAHGLVVVSGGTADGGIAVAGTGDAHSNGPACLAVIGDCYGGAVAVSLLGASHPQ